MGGKPPSNSLLVIKMDAIYFFWHSNYTDVCRQLFVLTWSILSAAVSPLTFDTVSPQAWQALTWGVRLAREPPRLGWTWLPWDAERGCLMFPGWSRGGGEAGALLSPLLSHCLHFFPLLSPHSQTPALLPTTLCVNENSGSLMVRKKQSLTLRQSQRTWKVPSDA